MCTWSCGRSKGVNFIFFDGRYTILVVVAFFYTNNKYKLPMQKFSTQHSSDLQSMQVGPSDQSIQRILQFAANYRSQKVSNNCYVDFILS